MHNVRSVSAVASIFFLIWHETWLANAHIPSCVYDSTCVREETRKQSGCRTESVGRTSVRVVIENSSGMPQFIFTCEMKCLPKTLTSSLIFCQLALFLACNLPIRPFSDQFATQFIGSRPVNESVHFLLPSVLKIDLKSLSHFMQTQL